MYMVCILHLLGQGGALYGAVELSSQYKAAWFLEIMAYCAVNCYGLISGYVGIYSKHSYLALLKIWLQTFLWNIIIVVAFCIAMPLSRADVSIKNLIFPVLTKQYWYVTAYVGLFLFMPLLNIALNNIEKELMRNILIGLLVAFSVLPVITGNEPFGLMDGYSVLWLMVLYLVGGYIRKYDCFRNAKKTVLMLIYLVNVLLTWIIQIGLDYKYKAEINDICLDNPFSRYISPTIMLCAVALLCLFVIVNVPMWLTSIVKWLSPLTLGVYIIHTNPFVWKYVLKDRLVGATYRPWWQLIVIVLGVAAVLYIGCSILDYFRYLLFKKIFSKK